MVTIEPLLKLLFALAVLIFVLAMPITIVLGIIGLITDNYKWFKISLKVLGFNVLAFVISILGYAFIIFLGRVLGV